MKARPPLPHGPFLVLGLARSGLAAALALRARGHDVFGADARRPDPERARELARAGVILLGEREAEASLDQVRTIVKSPGVPANVTLLRAARARSTLIMGELELAWRMLGNELLAITGTNGKTTTTELVGHLHRSAGVAVALAGNVGIALSSLALAPRPPRRPPVIVCEVSSFQLEDAICFSPEAAVVLNIAPDHLDRHGTFDAYRAAKLSIFAHQGAHDMALLPGTLDVDLRALGCRAREVRFGEGPRARVHVHAYRNEPWLCAVSGRSVQGDAVQVDAVQADGEHTPMLPVRDLSLRGEHNVQNALAASALCLERGIEPGAIAAGLRDFPGVPHRLEDVGTFAGVRYVNDSKATNVTSALVALGALSSERALIHVILGGQSKGQDFSPLRPALERCACGVYLIGQDAPLIAQALRGIAPPVSQNGELAQALAAARTRASPGEIVLLAPGCASFDQFSDFEERGERFRELAAGE